MTTKGTTHKPVTGRRRSWHQAASLRMPKTLVVSARAVGPGSRTPVCRVSAGSSPRLLDWTPQMRPPAPERLLLAAPRGSWPGVARAVQTVERALELYGAPVYVRKEIVHNKHVVAQLRERGAVFVEELDDTIPEDAITVFSAHGVSPAVHAEAAQRKLRTIDATCP